MRVADKLEIASAMLENTGTPAFYSHSEWLYGTPDALLLDKKTKTINLARHMDATLADLDFDKLVLGGEEIELSAQEFSEMLGDKLEKHFDGNAPKIVMTAISRPKCWPVLNASGSKKTRYLPLWMSINYYSTKRLCT